MYLRCRAGLVKSPYLQAHGLKFPSSLWVYSVLLTGPPVCPVHKQERFQAAIFAAPRGSVRERSCFSLTDLSQKCRLCWCSISFWRKQDNLSFPYWEAFNVSQVFLPSCQFSKSHWIRPKRVCERRKKTKKHVFCPKLAQSRGVWVWRTMHSLEHNATQPAWTFRPANSNWY